MTFGCNSWVGMKGTGPRLIKLGEGCRTVCINIWHSFIEYVNLNCKFELFVLNQFYYWELNKHVLSRVFLKQFSTHVTDIMMSKV